MFNSRLVILSVLLLGAYAIRVTIPAVWLYPVAPYVVNYSGFVSLAIASVFLLPNSRINHLALLLLLSLAATTLLSTENETAMIRFALWALMFIVAGPFFKDSRAVCFRNCLWEYSVILIMGITLLSFFWNILGLPLYGKGSAGVTMHCMLLGAIAGLATVLSCNRLFALTARSLLSWGVFAVSMLTCLMAGSRAAVLAAGVGCMAVFIMKLRGMVLRSFALLGVLTLAAFLWVSLDFGDSDLSRYESSGVLSSYTKELFDKGRTNTRQQLWENRLVEFDRNPIAGVGIGIDTYSDKKSVFGGSVVEPGSSYLAVLAMTGLLGFTCLTLLFINLGHQVVKRSRLIPAPELTQVVSVGAFWSVHAIAEGWIFAAGSLLCLLFWIWVGRLASLAVTLPEHRTA